MVRRKTRPKLPPHASATWLALFGAVTSIVAVVLAWNANRIATEQNHLTAAYTEPRVVVLSQKRTSVDLRSAIPAGGTDADATDAVLSCGFQLRFANLGGGSDAIVNFDTSVHYLETLSSFEGYGEASGSYLFAEPSQSNPRRATYSISPELRRALLWLSVILAEEESSLAVSRDWERVLPADFPLQIGGLETVDTEVFIVFRIVSGTPFNLDNELGQLTLASQSLDLPPLNFHLQFTLASGETLEPSPLECGILGKQP